MGHWTEADSKLAYWGMALHLGVARTQNPASQYMNDVRDEGAVYKGKNSSGDNTNAGLDFHTDSADVVGLLCRRTAQAGVERLVASTMAVAQALGRRRPDVPGRRSRSRIRAEHGGTRAATTLIIGVSARAALLPATSASFG